MRLENFLTNSGLKNKILVKFTTIINILTRLKNCCYNYSNYILVINLFSYNKYMLIITSDFLKNKTRYFSN